VEDFDLKIQIVLIKTFKSFKQVIQKNKIDPNIKCLQLFLCRNIMDIHVILLTIQTLNPMNDHMYFRALESHITYS